MVAKRSVASIDEAEKRKAARERRANVKVRALKSSANPEPALQEPSIRAFPNPVVLPGTDPSVLFPVYIPNPAQRDSEGRRPLRELVRRIRAAAGVTALLAYDHRMAAQEAKNEGSELAMDSVARKASLTPDYLFRLGRKELGRQAQAEDFDRLVALAYDGPEHALTGSRAKLADMHLEALGLLTTPLLRAERIIAANDEAFRTKDGTEAGKFVIEAYGHGKVEISRADLVRIAALADINPAPLWIQHAQDMAPVLEIARFGGKLVKASRRGGQIRLDRRLFSALRLVLGQTGFWPDAADTEAAFLLTARLVGACVDLRDLLSRLEWCDDFEMDLVIGEVSA